MYKTENLLRPYCAILFLVEKIIIISLIVPSLRCVRLIIIIIIIKYNPVRIFRNRLTKLCRSKKKIYMRNVFHYNNKL